MLRLTAYTPSTPTFYDYVNCDRCGGSADEDGSSTPDGKYICWCCLDIAKAFEREQKLAPALRWFISPMEQIP